MLRQRIHTLETALETAQQAKPTSDALPADELFAVLQREVELLKRSQEEEEHFIEQLRELSRQRLVQLSERLFEIRRIAGDNPEQMIASAVRGRLGGLPGSIQRPQDADRIATLEKAIADARDRESALQRQLRR